MIWSKTKKAVEGLLAESLQGRVKYYMTRYGPGFNLLQNRAWITLDGQEVMSCSTMGWIRENYNMTGELRWDADKQTEGELTRKGYFFVQTFVASLADYLDMSIEEAIQSTDVIVRAVAMFDRRLGKRRLQAMRLGEDENPMVKRFYEIRCQAEGIKRPTELSVP
jgi:hypothetical protein